MNTLFEPTKKELDLIIELREIIKFDFSYFRMTETMVKKSIIDASFSIRNILKENNIIDFEDIDQGEILFRECLILSRDNLIATKSSFYRPKTKSGDPRFWPSGLNKLSQVNDLILFTFIESKCVLIVLKVESGEHLKQLIQTNFRSDSPIILKKLVDNLRKIKNSGWIDSVSPTKKYDKDVGLTLEREIGIEPNSSNKPDYFDEIELKSKGKTKTLDSLFGKVPNWDLCTRKKASNIPSDIKNARYYLLEFGIPSEKHPNYKCLYVTVKSMKNAQGMYLVKNDKKEYLLQHFSKNDHILASCVWEYSTLEKKLLEKHNKTIWVKADERVHNDKIQFKYKSFEFSERASINTFLSLIPSNIIGLDWTHRVLPDGSKSNDHGFLWRIDPRYRELLFNKVIPIIST